MNFEESDSFKGELERNARSRKNVVISLAFCAFLIVCLLVLIAFLRYQDSITEKLFVDGNQVPIPNGFYRNIDGEIYVDLRQIGAMFGYDYTKGVYGEFNEDNDSCYMKNSFELIAVTAGADRYTKHLVRNETNATIGTLTSVRTKNKEGYSESFKLEKPLKYEDGILYLHQNYIAEMFNVQVDWKEYRINFYTLNYLQNYANQTLARLGFVDLDNNFENLKALNYNLMIVGNGQTQGTSDLYGVYNLSTGAEIISMKYDEIIFVQNAQEFYITAANGTVGIFDKEGKTVIAPSEFEKISLLDQENKLYLVEKDGEYGVLDRTGEILVYAEYDAIGIKIDDFIPEEIDDGLLLFDKCIPVKKDGNYGLYSIDGKRLLDTTYDGFGYKSPIKTTSSGSEQSAILIPSYVGVNGIVVNLDDKFGIFDVNTNELIIPIVCDKIYSIKIEGERTYYVSYMGNELELSQYLKDNNLNNVNENGELLTETSGETVNVEQPVEEQPVEGEPTEEEPVVQE